MAITERRFPTITTSATPSPPQQIDLPGDGIRGGIGRILGFRARLTGSDVLTRVRFTDLDGTVVFLDAADVDYKTALVDTRILLDDTQTGLGFTPRDLTGAAIVATVQNLEGVLARFPVAASIINGGTVTDTVDITAYVDDRYRSVFASLITSTDPSPGVVMQLPGGGSGSLAVARIDGFAIRLTGTDTGVRLKLVDADNRVVYLDAADKDYKTALIKTRIIHDDTLTGISSTPRDATGTVLAASQGLGGVLARFPVTASIVGGTTVTDTVALELFVH
jgi:hypothetical protein